MPTRGSGIGLNLAPPLELLGRSNDRASRCDEFMNPRFAEVPGCTDPNRGSGAGWKTAYDRAAGLLAGLSAGYRFGERLRVEAEWLRRESEYDQTSPGGERHRRHVREAGRRDPDQAHDGTGQVNRFSGAERWLSLIDKQAQQAYGLDGSK